MNPNELRAVVESLSTLESLAALFNNLWFQRVKEQVEDEKARAYLMVFADAFPGMNHVIEFVQRNAGAFVASGDAKVAGDFAELSRRLLGHQSAETAVRAGATTTAVAADDTDAAAADDTDAAAAAADSEKDEIDDVIDTELFDAESPRTAADAADLPEEERASLGKVDQDDIDALFSSGDSGEDTTQASDEDIQAFLASAYDAEDSGMDRDAGSTKVTEQEDTFAGLDEAEDAAGELDLDDLLSDQEEEEDGPTSEGPGPEISADEMRALLGDPEQGEESQPPDPSKKPAAAAGKHPAARSAAKPKSGSSARDAGTVQPVRNSEETVSQDEIDALFG